MDQMVILLGRKIILQAVQVMQSQVHSAVMMRMKIEFQLAVNHSYSSSQKKPLKRNECCEQHTVEDDFNALEWFDCV